MKKNKNKTLLLMLVLIAMLSATASATSGASSYTEKLGTYIMHFFSLIPATGALYMMVASALCIIIMVIQGNTKEADATKKKWKKAVKIGIYSISLFSIVMLAGKGVGEMHTYLNHSSLESNYIPFQSAPSANLGDLFKAETAEDTTESGTTSGTGTTGGGGTR